MHLTPPSSVPTVLASIGLLGMLVWGKRPCALVVVSTDVVVLEVVFRHESYEPCWLTVSDNYSENAQDYASGSSLVVRLVGLDCN